MILTPTPRDQQNIAYVEALAHLLSKKYLEKWTSPKVPEYKGKSDHVIMEDITERRDLWCRMFPGTLVDEAINWYTNLPLKCINSFEKLKEKNLEALTN